MDRKSLGVVAICVVFLFLWGPLVNKIWPPIELTPEQIAQRAAAAAAATNQPSPTAAVSSSTGPAATVPETASLSTVSTADVPETLEVLQDDLLKLTFTSRGGGLQTAELKEFPLFVSQRGDTNTPRVVMNQHAPVPVMAIVSDNLNYDLVQNGREVTATATTPDGLIIRKVFTLSTNYHVLARLQYENPTDRALRFGEHQLSLGSTTPLGNPMDMQFTGLLWYDGEDKEIIHQSWYENKLLGCIPREERPVYIGGSSNVIWGGVQNQFFTVLTVPGRPADKITATRFDLPAPTAAELAAHPKMNRKPVGQKAALIYPGFDLQPGQSMEENFLIFIGPKEYSLLSEMAFEQKNDLDLVMDFSGFFGFFAKALLLSMNALHNSTGMGYGIAIVVITLIIRMVFWPLTTASTRSMKRMAKLQPEMKKIQEKYKEDPAKMQKETLKFMKENKINPMGSCLPMLLQMPVFFGFYRMLQSAIELRGAPFLWITDLSSPDTLFYIPGLHFPFNPLPLIMGATMLYQARLTPASPSMDPTQQTMMRYMPLIFMVFLYNMSSGLVLYWTVSNVMSIIQTKLTKLNDEKVEARSALPAKAAPVKKAARRKN